MANVWRSNQRRIRELEAAIAKKDEVPPTQKELELEARIAKLERCNHKWEEVGGRNTNYKKFFNGCNAYIRCEKCGHRKRV